jgi:predicted amidohydrolase
VTLVRLAAVAAHFNRDVPFGLDRIRSLVAAARDQEVALLVLPDAALGGYLADIRHPDAASLPPSFAVDDPIFEQLCQIAGDITLCLGYCEQDGAALYNSAVALHGDGVLGRHRKVHQPPGEAQVYQAGSSFLAFDSPVGRMGMLIDYDKTFPEASRTLALDGARTLAFLSAWPASVTRRATQLVHDRQTRLFDIYDAARAAENQVVVVSSNQTGAMGDLRFFGHAKVVGPGGETLARTGVKAGLAVAQLDLDGEVDMARRVQSHLKERRTDAYGT